MVTLVLRMDWIISKSWQRIPSEITSSLKVSSIKPTLLSATFNENPLTYTKLPYDKKERHNRKFIQNRRTGPQSRQEDE